MTVRISRRRIRPTARRTAWSVFAFVGGSSATYAIQPSDALAIVPPEEIVLSATEFPEGALITGSLECDAFCDMESLKFYDSMGALLTGSFVDVSAMRPDLGFAWESSVPLVEGTYDVELEGGYASATFEVVAAEPSPPTFESVLMPLTTGRGDPIVCVETVEEDVLVFGDVYPGSLTEADLYVSVSGLTRTQYAYLLQLEESARESFAGTGFGLNLGAEQVQACFEVFAAPLDDGQEISLGQDCVDTSELDGLGQMDVVFGELGRELDDVLSRCVVPPSDYQGDWCAFFEPAFVEHSCEGFFDDACVAARHDCPGGDLPEFDHTPTGDTETAGQGDGSTDPDQSGSCGFRAPTYSGRGLPVGLLVVVMGSGLLARRRFGCVE